MKNNRKLMTIFHAAALLLFCVIGARCDHEEQQHANIYKYQQPEYDQVSILAQPDTLHFTLNENTFNVIKSFNHFTDGNAEYLSFYDRRSESINFFDLHSQRLVKRIELKEHLEGKFYKTSVFCNNFDSIFITNRSTFYMIDSAGRIKKSVDFLDEPRFALGFFENSLPMVVKNNKAYLAVRPFVQKTSRPALKKWKVMYQIDLITDKVSLHYNLPEIYQNNFFSSQFFDYSYCYNHKGNFVLSFPADTSVRETDLQGLYREYHGRSSYQRDDILPVDLEDLKNDKGLANYITRDTYGEIYFDQQTRRYLRVAKSKTSEEEYKIEKVRKQRLIIFDDKFKIIGESPLDKDIMLNSIFFTVDGKIYARVNSADEYALHFVRLDYREKANTEITKISPYVK